MCSGSLCTTVSLLALPGSGSYTRPENQDENSARPAAIEDDLRWNEKPPPPPHKDYDYNIDEEEIHLPLPALVAVHKTSGNGHFILHPYILRRLCKRLPYHAL